jgi:hypothetical protein
MFLYLYNTFNIHQQDDKIKKTVELLIEQLELIFTINN